MKLHRQATPRIDRDRESETCLDALKRHRLIGCPVESALRELLICRN